MADKCMTQEKHQTSNNSIWRCNLVLAFDSPLAVPSMAWFGTVQHFWALQKKFSRKIARVYCPWWEFAWFCLCYRIAIFHLMIFWGSSTIATAAFKLGVKNLKNMLDDMLCVLPVLTRLSNSKRENNYPPLHSLIAQPMSFLCNNPYMYLI